MRSVALGEVFVHAIHLERASAKSPGLAPSARAPRDLDSAPRPPLRAAVWEGHDARAHAFLGAPPGDQARARASASAPPARARGGGGARSGSGASSGSPTSKSRHESSVASARRARSSHPNASAGGSSAEARAALARAKRQDAPARPRRGVGRRLARRGGTRRGEGSGRRTRRATPAIARHARRGAPRGPTFRSRPPRGARPPRSARVILPRSDRAAAVRGVPLGGMARARTRPRASRRSRARRAPASPPGSPPRRGPSRARRRRSGVCGRRGASRVPTTIAATAPPRPPPPPRPLVSTTTPRPPRADSPRRGVLLRATPPPPPPPPRRAPPPLPRRCRRLPRPRLSPSARWFAKVFQRAGLGARESPLAAALATNRRRHHPEARARAPPPHVPAPPPSPLQYYAESVRQQEPRPRGELGVGSPGARPAQHHDLLGRARRRRRRAGGHPPAVTRRLEGGPRGDGGADVRAPGRHRARKNSSRCRTQSTSRRSEALRATQGRKGRVPTQRRRGLQSVRKRSGWTEGTREGDVEGRWGERGRRVADLREDDDARSIEPCRSSENIFARLPLVGVALVRVARARARRLLPPRRRHAFSPSVARSASAYAVPTTTPRTPPAMTCTGVCPMCSRSGRSWIAWRNSWKPRLNCSPMSCRPRRRSRRRPTAPRRPRRRRAALRALVPAAVRAGAGVPAGPARGSRRWGTR